MSEVKTSEILEILDKLEMFQGQRAGRELWADKPAEIQEQDLTNFNRDIGTIRKYIESQNNVLQRIVERLNGKKKTLCGTYDFYTKPLDRPSCKIAFNNGICESIQVVKEVGGIE